MLTFACFLYADLHLSDRRTKLDELKKGNPFALSLAAVMAMAVEEDFWHLRSMGGQQLLNYLYLACWQRAHVELSTKVYKYRRRALGGFRLEHLDLMVARKACTRVKNIIGEKELSWMPTSRRLMLAERLAAAKDGRDTDLTEDEIRSLASDLVELPPPARKRRPPRTAATETEKDIER